jgi:hypothetical protein
MTIKLITNTKHNIQGLYHQPLIFQVLRVLKAFLRTIQAVIRLLIVLMQSQFQKLFLMKSSFKSFVQGQISKT